jgi:hypothetical protein
MLLTKEERQGVLEELRSGVTGDSGQPEIFNFTCPVCHENEWNPIEVVDLGAIPVLVLQCGRCGNVWTTSPLTFGATKHLARSS